MQKYIVNYDAHIPHEMRREINEKILYLINTHTAEESGSQKEISSTAIRETVVCMAWIGKTMLLFMSIHKLKRKKNLASFLPHRRFVNSLWNVSGRRNTILYMI